MIRKSSVAPDLLSEGVTYVPHSHHPYFEKIPCALSVTRVVGCCIKKMEGKSMEINEVLVTDTLRRSSQGHATKPSSRTSGKLTIQTELKLAKVAIFV